MHRADHAVADAIASDLAASSLGVHILRGACRPGRGLGPLPALLQQALARLGPRALDAREEAGLACAAGCHARWWEHTEASSLADHARVDHGVPLPRRELVRTERRIHFFDAVYAVLEKLGSRQPVVLIIERADWLDKDTQDLLLRCLRPDQVQLESERFAMVVILTTPLARDDSAGDPSETLDALRRLPSCEAVTAGELDEGRLSAYLRQPNVVRWILEQTGGDAERLGRWLAQPPTQERVVLRDSGARADDVLDALRVASLLGRSVPIAQLCDGEPAVQRLEQGLERVGALERNDAGAAVVAWPRPAPVLDKSDRARVHARCARVLRSLGEYEEAAWHAARGDDPELHASVALTVEPLLSARHAHADAAQLLCGARDRFRASEGESARPYSAMLRTEIDARLAKLWSTLGDYARGLEAARALCAARPDDARATLCLGEILLRAGVCDEAIEVLARVTSRDAISDRLGAEARCLSGEALLTAGRLDEAKHAATDALAAARALGDVALSIDAENVLGKVDLARAETAAARRHFERNAMVAVDHGLHRHECVARQNLGITWLREGRLDEAQRELERAAELGKPVGAAWHRAIALENLAVIHHVRGRWSLAYDCYRDACAMLARMGHGDWQARVLFNLADLACTLGDAPRARDLARAARTAGGESLFADTLMHGLVVEGNVHLALGSEEPARACFEEAGRHARNRTSDPERVAIGLARCALAEGQPSKARAILQRAPATEQPRRHAERASLEADVAVATGEPARAYARAALDSAVRAEHVVLELRGYLRLATILSADGDAEGAADVIARAHALEERMRAEVPEALRDLFSARHDGRALAALRDQVTRETSVEAGKEPGAGSAAPQRGLIGSSRAMRELRSMIARIGPSDVQVLITGESGTGKELVAEALHLASRRARKPLVRVNCAALAETLLLSELFGHEKGAFTGAHTRRIGRFEAAQGGTIFLDEIGDVSPRTQAALLRVLQERSFERVGGTTTIEVDVRVVAATHRPLEALVARGELREDLYYRLRGVIVEVPPLRSRRDDVAPIARHLLRRIASAERIEPKTLTPDALAVLTAHDWRGNVRELENVLRSVSLLSPDAVLDADAFADHLRAAHARPIPEPPPTAGGALEEKYWSRILEGESSLYEVRRSLEQTVIARAIAEANGNLAAAARRLGMKRPRLSQLAKEYGLSKGQRR